MAVFGDICDPAAVRDGRQNANTHSTSLLECMERLVADWEQGRAKILRTWAQNDEKAGGNARDTGGLPASIACRHSNNEKEASADFDIDIVPEGASTNLN